MADKPSCTNSWTVCSAASSLTGFHLSVQRRCLLSYTLYKEKNRVERGREPQFNFNIYWASKIHSYETFMENTELSAMLTWQKTISGRLRRTLRDCPIGVK